MAVPTTFPVLMSKPGSPDAQVNDLLSYNVMLAQGYTYGVSTPNVVIETAPDLTVTVVDDPLTGAQSDPLPGEQDQIS